jgi:hypothetical protein
MRHIGVSFLNWGTRIFIIVLPLFSPLVVSVGCGSGRDEEPSGREVLRLIRDPFSDVESARNYASLSSQFAARSDRRFQFQKRSQYFIGVHNEPLVIVPMRISNPDRSPVGING